MKYIKIDLETILAMPGFRSHLKLSPEEKERRKKSREDNKKYLAEKEKEKQEEKKKHIADSKERFSKHKDPISYKDLKETFEGLYGEKENVEVLKRWAYNLYFYCNKKHFNNKLKVPLIRIGILHKHGAPLLGFWRMEDHTLYIDSDMFNTSFEEVEDTIVHEMCHQAVSEIDQIDRPHSKNFTPERYKTEYDPDLGGHGTAWFKWMKHCGLPLVIPYMGSNDSLIFNKRIMDDKKLIYEAKNRGMKEIKKPFLYKPVAFITPDKEWKIGLISNPNGYMVDVVTDLNDRYPIPFKLHKLWEPTEYQLKEFNKDLSKLKKVVDKMNSKLESNIGNYSFFWECETNKIFKF